MNFNKKEVLDWMKHNKHYYVDPKTNELNFTTIVEAAADAFDEDYENGPLDDGSHWIWECPLDI